MMQPTSLMSSASRNALIRALAGKPPIKLTREAKAERTVNRMSGVITRNVVISDINQGAWSYIGQPPATRDHNLDFLD